MGRNTLTCKLIYTFKAISINNLQTACLAWQNYSTSCPKMYDKILKFWII